VILHLAEIKSMNVSRKSNRFEYKDNREGYLAVWDDEQKIWKSADYSLPPDVIIHPRTGMALKMSGGDLATISAPPLAHMMHRIISMNLLGKNQKAQTSEWELTLDCGHSLRETTGFWDTPKFWYRDCHQAKRH
jgi:hypothetical protein